jgi:hypothetical protein
MGFTHLSELSMTKRSRSSILADLTLSAVRSSHSSPVRTLKISQRPDAHNGVNCLRRDAARHHIGLRWSIPFTAQGTPSLHTIWVSQLSSPGASITDDEEKKWRGLDTLQYWSRHTFHPLVWTFPLPLSGANPVPDRRQT